MICTKSSLMLSNIKCLINRTSHQINFWQNFNATWNPRAVTYVACPKSPVTHSLYSERIAGTNQSDSCRIIGHIGTYFTVQHYTHFNDVTAAVTLVTMSRHDRGRSNYAKCFRNFYFFAIC